MISCRVCGRTLLMGERSTGFFTANGEGPFDVCELCIPRADRFGLRPQPSTPDEVSHTSRRGRRWVLRLPTGARRAARISASAPVGTAALPVALAAFNESNHAHTLAGLYKTLGAPRASVVPRSPTDREVILTVAWEIVWYQFRILADGAIEQTRGTYLSDLPMRWREWNCSVSASGKVAAPQPDQIVTAEAPSGTVTAPEPERLTAAGMTTATQAAPEHALAAGPIDLEDLTP